MKLRVSLRAPGAHQASNIQVTADATATVHDVAEALAGALGHDDTPANLTLRVNDQLTGHSHVVPAGVALIDSGVQSGTVLELSTEDVGGRGAQREAAAILRVVARAVIACICGPPCSPGKTARSNFRPRAASVVITTAPRGPSRGLVTSQAINTGGSPATNGPEIRAIRGHSAGTGG